MFITKGIIRDHSRENALNFHKIRVVCMLVMRNVLKINAIGGGNPQHTVSNLGWNTVRTRHFVGINFWSSFSHPSCV